MFAVLSWSGERLLLKSCMDNIFFVQDDFNLFPDFYFIFYFYFQVTCAWELWPGIKGIFMRLLTGLKKHFK